MSDAKKDEREPRRVFLNVAIAGSAATLGVLSGYPVARFLRPSKADTSSSTEVGELDKFPRGTAQTVLLGEKPALVIRLDDGSLRAYLALCTHLNCVVGYSKEHKRIECGCHGGVYSLEGDNISGPPPRPLQALDVSVVNGVITIKEA